MASSRLRPFIGQVTYRDAFPPVQIEEPFGILPLETITYSLNQSIDTLVRARCARHPEHIRYESGRPPA